MSKLFRNSDANLQAFGQQGFDYVTTGTINADTYIAITALEDATITATATVGDSLTSVVVPAGVTVYSRFSSITVEAGKILAYREAQG